mgnify:CR=1 FL=1
MASTIVEARGVTKDFGTIQAVKGVDLSIAPGELFGLIGHNGAGKSTLFKMMLGLIPITSGEIRLDGESIGGKSPDELARRGDLVPFRLRAANRQPGGLVDVDQLRHLVSGEHPTDRGTVQPQVIRDPVRTPPAGEPQRHDPPLRLPREPVRRGLRPEAAVRQRQPGPIPVDPPFRRRGRALEPFRCPPQRPAPIHDEDSKTTTPFRRQRRVSVGHEDLRGQDASVVTHILPGGLRYLSRSQPVGEVQLGMMPSR